MRFCIALILMLAPAFGRGRSEDARRDNARYEDMRANGPDDIKAMLKKGESLIHAGQLAKAQSFFENALAKIPNNPDVSFNLGMVFFLQLKWPKAIENYSKSLSVKPDQIDPLYYLAQAYYHNSEPKLALKTIAHAAELAPGNPDVCQEYGEYLAETPGKREEGLKWLEKAQTVNPGQDRIDFDIGLAQFNLHDFVNRNDYKGAIVSLQAALKKDPTNGEAAFLLAECWSALSEWERARDNFEYAFSHGYSSTSAFYGLGTALVQLGNYEGAIAPLKKALLLDHRCTRYTSSSIKHCAI